MEFSLIQTSRGEKQQQKPMLFPPHIPELSPRKIKRQKTAADLDYPQLDIPDDAFVYLDHDLPLYTGAVRIVVIVHCQ